MNKTMRYALGAVLSAALVVPAIAQDNFPDVPDNHWAYEALQNMKNDGLLVGYPDGLFRGGRPASRYELAVAIHATYQRLKGITDGLDSQIKTLTASLDGKADKADLQSLRDALTALQNDVNGMKAWGDDIANLKKLASTFEKEIASLGVDVEAMKKDLGDLKDRVDKLEKRKPAVDIHGTVDMMALGGYSTSDRLGISVDGRPIGVGSGDYAEQPVGMTRNLSVFHEGALTFSGTNEEGPKWKATLVIGNMLSSAAKKSAGGLGNQSDTEWEPFGDGMSSVYFQDFAVTFDTSVLGQNFNAEVGRTGYKVSPYIFQRPDTTPYFANDRWDDGNWMFDGANLGFKLGQAKLNVFGGRKSAAYTSGNDGDQIQPMNVGRNGGPFSLDDDIGGRPVGLDGGYNALDMPIDQLLGLNLVAPITEKAQLNVAYLWLDSNSVGALNSVTAYNRLSVFGGDLKLDLDPITIDGGYSATNLQYNGHNVIDTDNYAWWINGAYKAEKWGLNAGYKEIQPNFAAPGDWGRIGIWWNPTQIKGFTAGGNVDLTEKLSLKGTGEWYTGIDNADAATLQDDDKINRYTVGVGYKLNANWNLDLGWEYVQYDLKERVLTFGGIKPTEKWYNIGLNYGFNANTKLSVLWQISDYDGKDSYVFRVFGDPRYTGGLLTTQLSVKF